ncbi:hypothetical protein [Halobellus ruber]|uniref:Uncharacterized protein n=1 Tax=Halobellus ruber TaxID=2761102 RepID=A0A7J9SKL9_9EURY|nr:hypothetical protein [Halobellus ruber]MBB6645571.1 hypothetical protein [Halobellus ruber]
MGVQEAVKTALQEDRQELIRVLAEHRVRPTPDEQSEGTSLGGLSAAPSFRFETEAGGTAITDRQTRSAVVDALGVHSEADCEAVREEIADHAAWDG